MHQEALLRLLAHRPADGPDGPAQPVQAAPAPLAAVDLPRQLLRHHRLRVDDVQVGEEDEDLAHALVQHDRVRLLHRLAHNLAVLILHNQDFLGLYHAVDQDHPQVRQDVRVQRTPGCLLFHRLEERHRMLVEEARDQAVPILQAHLEHFPIFNQRQLQ